MNRFIKKVLIIFFSIIISLSTYGQYIVKRVTDQPVNTAQDGFFYSLPLTVLKVNIVYEKLEKIRGPLSDYTLNYLGTSDYIASNSTSYRIIDVNLITEVTADPDQRYYVQFPAQREKDQKPMTFNLSELGTLIAFDDADIDEPLQAIQQIDQTFILHEDDQNFDYQADYNRKKQLDTITRRITIDTVSIDRFIFKTTWVDKSEEDKANEAAMQIARIRESRFNLLTGYQEVNYGESMKYMDAELRKLEQQYLELFLGKELKSIESQTLYYSPEKGSDSKSLLDLSDGSQIRITLSPDNSVENLPENPLEKVDNIYYRIPDQAIIEIEHNGTVYLRKSITVNQFGVVTTAPLNRTRTQFDFKTGGLKKIVRE